MIYITIKKKMINKTDLMVFLIRQKSVCHDIKMPIIIHFLSSFIRLNQWIKTADMKTASKNIQY